MVLRSFVCPIGHLHCAALVAVRIPDGKIGYPAMADGHKGRALQEDRNVHEEHTSALSERQRA